ncbi:MAG: zf-HC2 domain-containing protein [Stomatobaculum sp.]|nr:zf-HC2 domain-containing protein [Stomatobaculum sp.]
MDCYTAEQKITGFIQNELDDAETEAFLSHIRGCESCRRELETHYFIVEGLRMLDTDSDDFDVKGTMERAIRSAYQHLRVARGWSIVRYSVNTLIFLSVLCTLLLELRIVFWKNG